MASTHSPLVWASLATVIATFATLVATGCDGIGGGAEVFAGSCEGDAYGKDMDTGSDVLEATYDVSADGDVIVIDLGNVEANCCPSPGADVSFDGNDVAVDFHDVTADEACNCMCVIDFEIRIPDVDPGDYTIELTHDGEGSVILEVTVP